MSAAAESIRRHWREQITDGALLGLFMVSACVFTTLMQHHASPIPSAVRSPFARGSMIGLAMGLSNIALVYSPLGRRSGAHMNPAVTLTFWRLGRVAGWDAVFYLLSQAALGATGVMVAAALLPAIRDPEVNYAVTRPGPWGVPTAFLAEVVMTFLMMSVVLRISSSARWSRFTGLCAGFLVWLFITFEGPVSGMSLNPARSLASALAAHDWTGLWIYFTAPPLGMLLAAEAFVCSGARGGCAKLDHDPRYPCIFCRRHAVVAGQPAPAAATTSPEVMTAK